MSIRVPQKSPLWRNNVMYSIPFEYWPINGVRNTVTGQKEQSHRMKNRSKKKSWWELHAMISAMDECFKRAFGWRRLPRAVNDFTNFSMILRKNNHDHWIRVTPFTISRAWTR
jgi:hypothetical protein